MDLANGAQGRDHIHQLSHQVCQLLSTCFVQEISKACKGSWQTNLELPVKYLLKFRQAVRLG
jgi:hypothetical protein